MARRTVLIILIISLLTIAFAVPAYCNDPAKKLGRGLSNMVTFPAELYFQFKETNDNDGVFAAATWGIIKGVGMSALRLAVGVYETITFPFPIPKDYMPILTEPEFVGENLVNSL
ncbi:MAG: exosortase system-associated protein, TIGR04073 family [Candidatus Omnitrophica bacterium]|nr:exosortase system-associated protein, TIGR04073 family [Candidatus Omnitrophota bacterium]